MLPVTAFTDNGDSNRGTSITTGTKNLIAACNTAVTANSTNNNNSNDAPSTRASFSFYPLPFITTRTFL